MNDRVLAIIVCYNPEVVALKRSLQAITQQGCAVIVVDNASTNIITIRTVIQELVQQRVQPGVQQSGQQVIKDQGRLNCKIELAEQARNLGLGAAHNIGIAYAQQRDYTHVLLLDQDSMPLEDMVPGLLRAHKQKSEGDKVSAVGATYLNADNGSESFFVRFGRLKFQRHYCAERDSHGCVEADFLISSGSLIALDTFSEVGLMDEDLFIDHVDTEWFLRAGSMGFKAYGVCNAMMQHGLGEQTHRVSLGGRQRNVPQHKSFRYYYIFRNSVLLYQRSYASGVWKWNDAQRLGMIMLMFGVFKAPRVKNLRAMLKGLKDGLRGVTGAVDV